MTRSAGPQVEAIRAAGASGGRTATNDILRQHMTDPRIVMAMSFLTSGERVRVSADDLKVRAPPPPCDSCSHVGTDAVMHIPHRVPAHFYTVA